MSDGGRAAVPAAEVLPHWDALRTLLAATGLTGYPHGDVPVTPAVDVDKRVKPYWVFYPGGGAAKFNALCAKSNVLDWPFTVVAVGGSVEQCLWVRDRICVALVDVTPVVTGRVSGRIRCDYEVGPPQREEPLLPPRFRMPLLFTLTTYPA